MDSTKGRASAALYHSAIPGADFETPTSSKSEAESKRAAYDAKAAAEEKASQAKKKAGIKTETFRLKVPPQADDEIPVVLKPKSERRVNTNKPSEPF